MMRRFKIVVSDRDYPDLSIEESILDSIDAEVVDAQCKSGGKALLKYITDADAILQQYAEIRQDVIKKLCRCKIIAIADDDLESSHHLSPSSSYFSNIELTQFPRRLLLGNRQCLLFSEV